jgi:hypothetical protein
MEKLEHELAALRARAATLHNRHAAAEAAFVDAEAMLQRHLLEADLDADEKSRTKLEVTVSACALTRDNFAKAITAQQAKIVEVEAQIAAERAVIERNAAADKLARDLDEIEKALPAYLTAARRLADAVEKVGHWHFESGEMGMYARNTQAQIEVAGAFTLQELRGMVDQIRTGAAPIPPKKPDPAPVAVVEQSAPVRTVFCLRSIKWDNGRRTALQYEDAELPLPLADKALRRGVCVSVTDDRRKTLKGARGGHHVNVDALDIVDLDDLDDPKAPYIGHDPVMAADFRVLDRSSEERTLQISVPRL